MLARYFLCAVCAASRRPRPSAWRHPAAGAGRFPVGALATRAHPGGSLAPACTWPFFRLWRGRSPSPRVPRAGRAQAARSELASPLPAARACAPSRWWGPWQTKLKSMIIDQGLSFSHGLANTPVCCPSRSSIVRGGTVVGILMALKQQGRVLYVVLSPPRVREWGGGVGRSFGAFAPRWLVPTPCAS